MINTKIKYEYYPRSYIVEILDNEGLNLQETRLNLLNQGYEDYWYVFIKRIINQAIHEIILDHCKEITKEI